ncbi:MAG: GNAT family N-acetyltransferase [Phycisphaeraceae bacterium]
MHPPASRALTYRSAEVQEIIDLRRRVLRMGMPDDPATFEGDDSPSTLHMGVFDAASQCVGCATMIRADWEGRPAYQLRGMATCETRQQQGIGRTLLKRLLDRITAETDVRLIWCNARQEAIGFYRKQGWRVVSDVFKVPTVGPHYKMRIDLHEAKTGAPQQAD